MFHNDVIAVGNQNVLFFHQQAFLHTEAALAEVRTKFGDGGLHFIGTDCRGVGAGCSEVLSVQHPDPHLPSGGWRQSPHRMPRQPGGVRLSGQAGDPGHPIKDVHYMDVKQSMRNGGGPACLRLQVAMVTPSSPRSTRPASHRQPVCRLDRWVEKHYRDSLADGRSAPSWCWRPAPPWTADPS